MQDGNYTIEVCLVKVSPTSENNTNNTCIILFLYEDIVKRFENEKRNSINVECFISNHSFSLILQVILNASLSESRQQLFSQSPSNFDNT